MSATDKSNEAVKTHWNKLTASWKTIGPELFVRLFKAHPEIKAFFKMFDGLDLEEIRHSPKLKAHAVNFRNAISSLVENLDDVDCFVVLVQKLAVNHFRRQVLTQQFQALFKFFITFIQEVGEADEITAKAWRKTLDLVENVFDEQIKLLQTEKSC